MISEARPDLSQLRGNFVVPPNSHQLTDTDRHLSSPVVACLNADGRDYPLFQVYFDIEIDGEAAGRITMGL